MKTGPLTRLTNGVFCWPKNRRFAAVADAEGKRVKMFVLQHAPCQLPECFANREIYVPLQCGRAMHGPIDGVALGDDTGENVSGMNADINEMTAIWWVGRHYEEIGNLDHVGFCHYRRRLAWSPGILGEHVVLACKTICWRTLRDFFAKFHPTEALDAFERQLADEFGREEAALFRRYMKGHVFFPCNCFVMSRSDFRRYWQFADRCVKIVAKLVRTNAVDRSGYDAFQKRIYGFILEWTTSYWIWRERREGRIRVVGCDIEDFDIPNRVNSFR